MQHPKGFREAEAVTLSESINRSWIADLQPVRRLDINGTRPVRGPIAMESLALRTGQLALRRDPQTGELLKWHVTRATLRDLSDVFATRKLRKLDCPLQWGHSNDPRDRCGTVQQLNISESGDELWVRFDVTKPEDADHIEANGLHTSIETREPWFDGAGNTYPIAISHLAIVNHPVVSDSVVRRLSIMLAEGKEQTQERKEKTMPWPFPLWAHKREKVGEVVHVTTRKLAEGETLVDGEEASSKEKLDISAVPKDRVGMAKELLGLLAPFVGMEDLKLPEDTSEDNFDERFAMLLPMLRSLAAKAKAASGMLPDNPADAPAEVITDLSLVDARAALTRVGELRREERTARTAAVQTRFQNELLTLTGEGRLTRDEFESVKQLGLDPAIGGSEAALQAVLKPYRDRQKTVNTDGQVRQLGLGSAAIPKTPEQMTSTEMTAWLKGLGV